MNIAIVDDDQNEANTITALVKEYAAAGRLPLSLSVFRCGEDFLENYSPYSYTVIFMDIYMGGMTGVEAARSILAQDRHAVIIFLTSSDEHMSEAFSLHVFDYIPKPADKDRIFKALDDLLMLKTDSNACVLTFTSDRADVSLAFGDIVCVKTGDKNYLDITDSSGECYQTRMTFGEVSKKLSSDPRFLLIIRGVLVNMEHIKQINDSCCILTNGLNLPVNLKNARKLSATWQNFNFDRIRADRRERRSSK